MHRHQPTHKMDCSITINTDEKDAMIDHLEREIAALKQHKDTLSATLARNNELLSKLSEQNAALKRELQTAPQFGNIMGKLDMINNRVSYIYDALLDDPSVLPMNDDEV